MADDKMPFTEHLSELRTRIIISVVSLLIGFVVIFYFSEFVFDFLTLPFKTKLSFQDEFPFLRIVPIESRVNPLIFTAPAEAFWMHIKISLVASFIFSLPVILSQIWHFIAPGLLLKERKYIGPFIIVATLLFVIGAAFCFFCCPSFCHGISP